MQDESSFHNTTGETGERLETYKRAAKSQDRLVHEYFLANPASKLTPEEVGKLILPHAPRTSCGRALSNLVARGILTKIDEKTPGRYGRPIHYWRLATNAARRDVAEEPAF